MSSCHKECPRFGCTKPPTKPVEIFAVAELVFAWKYNQLNGPPLPFADICMEIAQFQGVDPVELATAFHAQLDRATQPKEISS